MSQLPAREHAYHTDARGTEPFDKTYSLGYQVHHEDWSPFPRVNRLRQTFLDGEYYIDVERLRLVTEAYKEHAVAPRKLQCAYAFEKVLRECELFVYDDDLIVGEIAAPSKASPIYPEFSVDWIIRESYEHPTFEEREHDQFYYRNEDERREAVELCAWWKGKTVEDLINCRLDHDQLKGSEVGEKIFQTNLYHYAGTGHLAIDYPRLMKLGFGGLIDVIQGKLDALDMRDPEDGDKRDEYRAMIIMYRAAEAYIERYAALCEQKAAETADDARREELAAMAANLHEISAGAPKSFWQALQLFQIATSLIQVEGNGHSISYGRMDQWLFPFYEADIASGAISKEFALELIEVEYVKMNNPTKLKDAGSMAVRNGRGFGGESLTIGGVDSAGNDATNDLTMLMLEASAHTRMMNPWVCVRMHDKTPYELVVKTVECVRAGYGHPKVFNDGPAVKGMMRKGMPVEEARDYCVVGCVEIDLPGKEYGWHDAAYVNTPKMMEMVLNGGKSLKTGEQLGPDTGSLETYQSFEEVLESVDAQFAYWTDQMCSSLNIIDAAHHDRKPLPYVSGFYEDCVEPVSHRAPGLRHGHLRRLAVHDQAAHVRREARERRRAAPGRQGQLGGPREAPCAREQLQGPPLRQRRRLRRRALPVHVRVLLPPYRRSPHAPRRPVQPRRVLGQRQRRHGYEHLRVARRPQGRRGDLGQHGPRPHRCRLPRHRGSHGHRQLAFQG